MSEVNCSKSTNIHMICSRCSLKRLKDKHKSAILTLWKIAKVSQKLYYDFMAIVFPNMYACLFDFVGRMKVHSTIYQRVVAKKFYATKLNSTRSPQSHQCLNGFFLTVYCCCFISAYSFHNYLSLYGSKPSIGIKALPIFRSPANDNKSNAKKFGFRPNRNLTGTIYHWSVILRSFTVVLTSAKRDANGFFKFSYSPRTFDFATSCPKIKVWCMLSNGILFLINGLTHHCLSLKTKWMWCSLHCLIKF